jgi:hypothetical protein
VRVRTNLALYTFRPDTKYLCPSPNPASLDATPHETDKTVITTTGMAAIAPLLQILTETA